jgi:CheY-like chemotaxis protein
MTVASEGAHGPHIVQFYENDRFLHGAIAAFFLDPLRNGEPLIMIARPQTFDAVVSRLASESGRTPSDVGSRFTFVPVETAMREVMDGDTPDPVRFEQTFSSLIAAVQQSGRQGTVRIYGETVDVLSRAGNHVAAIGLEGLWNTLFHGRDISVLCGYALSGFDDDVRANHFRAVCRQHSDVIPAEGFTDAPDDRTRLEWVASLQQRARALAGAVADQAPHPVEAGVITISTVYVVDDDESVRRSLARLLASLGLPAHTYPSAEAFLTEVDPTSDGCLILDVQLVGMSGYDLQSRMTAGSWRMPVIAMSGSFDAQTEADMLGSGASAVLRKPFDAQSLIDALARASQRAISR